MDEFEEVDLDDKRLNKRLMKIYESMARAPESTINQACSDWAETKAAYRFFQNEKADAEKIMKAHAAKTASRFRSGETILAIQDTSYLVYTSHSKTKGLGGISMTKGRNVDKLHSKGLVMHSCLAATTEGLPIGILDQSIFARKPKGASRDSMPPEEKESYRWIESLKRAEESKGQAKIVTVCDREADFYDFLQAADEMNASFLVRANVDRRINKKSRYAEKDVIKLWELLRNRPSSGTFEVEVPSRRSGKRCAGREGRIAELDLKFGSFELSSPVNNIGNRSETLPSILMNAVYAAERDPPEGADAIEWMLLTNLSVESNCQALEMVRWYCLRWRIELFFKVLKSGFKILDCRLGDAQRLKRYITVMSRIAWRMLMLTYIARTDPSLPSSLKS